MIENVLVGDDIEGAEDDDDGDVVADVGEGGLDRTTALSRASALASPAHANETQTTRGGRIRERRYLSLWIPGHHLDLHRRNGLTPLLDRGPNLCQISDGRRSGLGEDINMIRCHPLLRNENFLRTINNEITSLNSGMSSVLSSRSTNLIIRTFVQFILIFIGQSIENTKF